MSIGRAVSFAAGKVHPTRLYIKLKNGNVYYHPTLMEREQMRAFAIKIKESGSKVQLKHWLRAVRTA